MAPSRSTTRRKQRIQWSRISDERLLDMRFKDLQIQLGRTFVDRCIRRLNEELEERDIRFRPHIWLSNEWFSPDGIPGIAVPFYLANERLMKLEKKQMLEVEGGTFNSCMRILRHEAGHCMDTAYRLHFKRSWQSHFGSFAEPYPESYKPKPDSRKFVVHLDGWYAQAHPAEDFAETFAVWLNPKSRWRSRYRTWPAMRKLEYVDELMKSIAGTRPKISDRREIDPVHRLTTTLGEHYRTKRLHYSDEWPEFFDSDLRKIFSTDPKYADRPTAASFLRKIRVEMRELIAQWTGLYQYTIDQVLRDMIDRCKELKLRMTRSDAKTREQVMIMLAVQTMNFVHAGNYRVAL